MDMDWSPLHIVKPASPGSTQKKSDLFHDRLRQLLEHCDPVDVPTYKSRFSRKWFSERVGCATATLTSSPRLRKLLGTWEEKHRSLMAPASLRLEDDDVNVVLFARPKTGGEILMIPVTFSKLAKQFIKPVPTLIWNEGFDEWVGDYARFLIFSGKHARSSVEETVKKLRQFRRFQRMHGVPYSQVNDDFLLAWEASMETSTRSSPTRRDKCLTAVHDFFKWAQGQGLLRNHVQIADRHEYDLPSDYVFPISSKLVNVNGRNGTSYPKWVSTLSNGSNHSTYGMRRTPTSTEVLRLGEMVEAHSRNSVRNKLIMDWALLTGARVSEILQIRESDLPDLDSLGDLFDEDGKTRTIEVWVERKNRGRSRLRVPCDLILRTIDYVSADEERLKIVDERLSGTRRNDTHVFLSEKTGEALLADSVTRIFGRFFRKAGIKKANIHRLRAKYITEIIEFQLDRFAEEGITVDLTSNWQETILITATQMMGHSHPMSLVPYLNEILQRRTTKDGRIEPRSTESQHEAVTQMMTHAAGRLRYHVKLAEAARLLDKKNTAEAREVLREMMEQLDELVVN